LSEPTPIRRRRWLRWLGYFCIFCLVALGLLGWYCTTDNFQQYVRRRVVAELEKATGGRVEVGSFHTIPFRLRVDVRNLIIHGREDADQIPLLQVDRVQAELRIDSLIRKRIRLHSLLVEHPVVHVIVYPDGSTNQPEPPVGENPDKTEGEDLFSLDVSRVEVHGGELLWQEKRILLDLDARDAGVLLHYSFLHRNYQVQMAVGNSSFQLQQHPKLLWHGDSTVALSRNHAEISTLNQ
jgi:translocation and assembly module TamB